jgi:glutamine synthetase
MHVTVFFIVLHFISSQKILKAALQSLESLLQRPVNLGPELEFVILDSIPYKSPLGLGGATTIAGPPCSPVA